MYHLLSRLLGCLLSSWDRYCLWNRSRIFRCISLLNQLHLIGKLLRCTSRRLLNRILYRSLNLRSGCLNNHGLHIWNYVVQVLNSYWHLEIRWSVSELGITQLTLYLHLLRINIYGFDSINGLYLLNSLYTRFLLLLHDDNKDKYNQYTYSDYYISYH